MAVYFFFIAMIEYKTIIRIIIMYSISNAPFRGCGSPVETAVKQQHRPRREPRQNLTAYRLGCL